MKTLKRIPKFKNEEEERKFWAENDATEFIDFSGVPSSTFSNLKHTTKSISIRLPVSLIDRLKTKANNIDVPYQSLIKMYLADAIDKDTLSSK